MRFFTILHICIFLNNLHNASLPFIESHKEHMHIFQSCFLLKLPLEYWVVQVSEQTLIDRVELMVIVLFKWTSMEIVVNLCSHACTHETKLISFAVATLVSHCGQRGFPIILVQDSWATFQLSVGPVSLFWTDATWVAIILLLRTLQVIGKLKIHLVVERRLNMVRIVDDW